jgi:hypothetical protein
MRLVLLSGAVVLFGAIAGACGDAATSGIDSTGTSSGTSGDPGSSGTSGSSGASSGTSGASSGTSGASSGTSGASSGSSGTSSGSSGTSSGSSGTSGGPPPGAGIPCDVQAILQSKCVACHADPPLNGSLSGLVTITDLLATAKEDPTKNLAQLSLSKMQGGTMPPGSPSPAADITAFQNWINANYVGTCGDGGAPPPPSDVFTNAPPYVNTVGQSAHNAGRDCMGGCHNHGFTFAGTIYDAAGKAVAGAEVRLVDSTGKGISVHSGSDGNFHSSTSWTGPAHIGARNATTKALMVSTVPTGKGGCNGCHTTGGTAPKIHLP